MNLNPNPQLYNEKNPNSQFDFVDSLIISDMKY